MTTLLNVLLCFLVMVLGVQSATTCESFNSDKSKCLAATENGVKCAYCTSGAVGSECLTETDAKGLPSSVFQCSYAAAKATFVDTYKSELILLDPSIVGSHVISPVPKVKSANELPVSLDYRSLGLLTQDLNQHIPVYCGSCWAHAALSSLADRLKIATKGTQRDLIPSVQALINCGNAGTCSGGDSNAANAWVFKNGGIPDVTCQAYQAKNMECSAINTCMTCSSSGGCSAVTKFDQIQIAEFGHVEGDTEIMAEILARGPVSAYLNANCILSYTGGINMYDTCNPLQINHAVQLNGWGVENGTEYWIARNSWGTYWGEQGFFRIVRGGKYQPGVAYWAAPVLPV